MKSLIKLKTTTLLVIPLVLACFALLPRAQAATPELLPAPAPDGFYTGFNTAEGLQALFNVNTAVGQFNTALGFKALQQDTSGAHNTAVGAQALLNNNIGSFNTAVGENAMVHNASGSMNMALGQGALAGNILGSFNTAMGFQALNANTVDDNTAVGFRALAVNSTGDDNTAAGLTALESNTTGTNNTAFGGQALVSNIASDNNTAVGWNALQFSNADPLGNPSTAVGSFALQHNTVGEQNNALGFKALQTNTDGEANNAFGHFALNANLHGDGNNAFGDIALSQSTGAENTAVGDEAGLNVTGGSGNTFLGSSAGEGVSSANNVICIGRNVVGANTSNRAFIGNIGTFAQAPSASVEFVTVQLATGRLGHDSSSRRYKEDIKPMDKASEVLYQLKPVTYRYKKDLENPNPNLDYGLVAEDVAEIDPELAVRDGKGQIESVRYKAIYNMMLNEFLKEHQTVKALKSTVEKQEAIIAQQQQDFQATVAAQQKQIEALSAGLQKVSEQVEVNKLAPQTVANK
jgi:trimeric autotransporter adhesin